MDNYFVNSVASAASAVSPSPSLCSSASSSVHAMCGIGGAGPSSSHTSPMMLYMMNSGGGSGGGGGAVAGTDGADAHQAHEMEEGEEAEPEQCLVCNDVATGYHYGTPSCNGCKTFFRRTVMKNQTFQCQYDGNCPVDKTVRCACRHCRFKKCLAVGMNKDAIQQNRDPIGYTKRTRRYPSDRQPRQKHQQQQSKQSPMTDSSDGANPCGSAMLSTTSASMPSSSFSGPGSSAYLIPAGGSSSAGAITPAYFCGARPSAYTPEYAGGVGLSSTGAYTPAYAGGGAGSSSAGAFTPAYIGGAPAHASAAYSAGASASSTKPLSIQIPALKLSPLAGPNGANFAGGYPNYNNNTSNNMQAQQQHHLWQQQQHQAQQQKHFTGANGTNFSHFGMTPNAQSISGGTSTGFMSSNNVGGTSSSSASSSSFPTPIYGNTNAPQNDGGSAGDTATKKQQQQQPPQNQTPPNNVPAEQMEEDTLLRRMIGIEQILIRTRNSKVNVRKTLSDVMMNSSSMFDDAAMVAKMSLEPFQMPSILQRAKQEDFVYWHEREWLLMIEWAKMLPVFHTLSIVDKLALLRHSAITFPSLLQCFYSPDVGPDTIVFPSGAFFDRTLDPTNSTGFQRKNFKMLDNLLSPIRKLQIDQNEFAGAKAIFFLNPDSDAEDLSPEAKRRIAVTRSSITNALYRYMVQKRGMEHAAEKFGKLLLLGTAIATMSCEMKEAVVVADFFSQVHFSSFARQLLLARDENDFHEDGDRAVQQSQQKVNDKIAKMCMEIVPNATTPTTMAFAGTKLPTSSMSSSASSSSNWVTMRSNDHNHHSEENNRHQQQHMWHTQQLHHQQYQQQQQQHHHQQQHQHQQFQQQQYGHGTCANNGTNNANYWQNIDKCDDDDNNNNNNNYAKNRDQQHEQLSMWMRTHGVIEADETSSSAMDCWMPAKVSASTTATPAPFAASIPASSVASAATTPAPLTATRTEHMAYQQQRHHTTHPMNAAQPWAQQQLVPHSSAAVASSAAAAAVTTKPTMTSTGTSPVGSDGMTSFNLQTHLMHEALQPIEHETAITTSSLHHHYHHQSTDISSSSPSLLQKQQNPSVGMVNPPSNGSISQHSSTSPPSLTNVLL